MLKQKKRGFLSVAMLLVMLTMTSIVLALLYRSSADLSLMRYAREGAETYQFADTRAENFLKALRDIDNSALNNGKIPENSPTSDLSCGASPIVCYTDINGTIPVTAANYVGDIRSAKAISNNSTEVRRALNISVPPRISNQASGLKIDSGSCATGITLSWQELRRKISVAAGAPKDPKNEVSGFSFRMNTTNNITAAGWMKLKDGSNNPISDPAIAANFSTDDTGTYRQTLSVASTNFSSGNTYYFIIKEKNTQPFRLDSNYTAPSDGAKITCP